MSARIALMVTLGLLAAASLVEAAQISVSGPFLLGYGGTGGYYGSVNQTTEGKVDWIHYSSPSSPSLFDRKAGGTAISNRTGDTGIWMPNGLTNWSWSDGTVNVNAPNTEGGYCRMGVWNILDTTFTVATVAGWQQVKVYVGTQDNGAIGVLNLSMPGATSVVSSPGSNEAVGIADAAWSRGDFYYVVTTTGGNVGDLLTVNWHRTSTGGGLYVYGAALTVPEPASLSLLILGGLALLRRRK